jgi:hypothetical protein
VSDCRPTVPAPASPAEHCYLAARRGASFEESLQHLGRTPCQQRVAAHVSELRGNLKLVDPSSQAAKAIRHEISVLGGWS